MHEWVPEAATPVPPAVPPPVPPDPPPSAVPASAGVPPEVPEPFFPEPVAPAMPARQAVAPPERSLLSTPLVAPGLAWVASLLLLVGLGWAAMHWQDSVVRAWPASRHAYAMLGR